MDELISGTINTETIEAAHKQIREIVDNYNEVNQQVLAATILLRNNWVGSGRDEFEVQYEHLISKISDFGVILKDIYDALVKAQAEYETTDFEIHQSYTM